MGKNERTLKHQYMMQKGVKELPKIEKKDEKIDKIVEKTIEVANLSEKTDEIVEKPVKEPEKNADNDEFPFRPKRKYTRRSRKCIPCVQMDKLEAYAASRPGVRIKHPRRRVVEGDNPLEP